MNAPEPESQRFLDYLLFSPEHINYATQAAIDQGLWGALTADFAGLESEFGPFHSQGCVCLQENWPSPELHTLFPYASHKDKPDRYARRATYPAQVNKGGPQHKNAPVPVIQIGPELRT